MDANQCYTLFLETLNTMAYWGTLAATSAAGFFAWKAYTAQAAQLKLLLHAQNADRIRKSPEYKAIDIDFATELRRDATNLHPFNTVSYDSIIRAGDKKELNAKWLVIGNAKPKNEHLYLSVFTENGERMEVAPSAILNRGCVDLWTVGMPKGWVEGSLLTLVFNFTTSDGFEDSQLYELNTIKEPWSFMRVEPAAMHGGSFVSPYQISNVRRS